MFSNLKLVVFSGGEALLLKNDLFASIAYCTSEGLLTRVVSNGYWGKTPHTAVRTAEKLKKAGLHELNLSTGKDHQEWVSSSNVVTAAVAAAEAEIPCLITIESDTQNYDTVNKITSHPSMIPHLKSGNITIQSNSWMPFHEDAEERNQPVEPTEFKNGCKQIFGTIVVTPHDNISACCGLTLEHIPEMRLGRNNGKNMENLYLSQLDDFMKIWIHVDGPYSIVHRVMKENATEHLKDIVHICEACSILHKTPEIRAAIRDRYREFIPEVMTRFKVWMAFREQLSQYNNDTKSNNTHLEKSA